MKNATNTKVVEVIKAKKDIYTENYINNYKKRVCAYCRVSTEHDEQITSYDAQVRNYTKVIKENPEYEFVKVYADRGISGTSTKNRLAFNEMIKDCRDGKIDLVITKSISRFARNILDCITYTRELKDLGVEVYFEKENIRTFDQTGEFVLTILGGLAQEESRSISKNTTWGIRHKFSNGELKINHNMFLGYTKDKYGNLVIEEDEAKIVRLIFKLYLEGYTLTKIKKELENRGIKTLRGNETWYESNILQILSNEKYSGSAILQKYYTTDFMNKKTKKNEGELDKYYVENSHEAIVSKEVFEEVQKKIESRKRKKETKYALSDLTYCGECGSKYRRTIWTDKKGNKKAVWRCGERIRNGKKNCKESVSLKEDELHNEIMKKLNSLKFDETYIKNIVIENIKAKLLDESTQDKALEIQMEINAINSKLLEENNENYNDEVINIMTKKITTLNKELEEIEKNINKIKLCELCINEKLAENTIKLGFNDTIIKKTVKQIIVVNEDEIVIKMLSNSEIHTKNKM